MSFHDSAVFPENISYGTSGGPGHSTRIVQGDSGAEVREQRWSAARARYTVRNVNKKDEDTAAIVSFYRGREGAAHGFRFKDHYDWSTGRNHTYPPSTDIKDRVQLQQGGDGTTVAFQLTKPYDSGGIRKWRTITRPMHTGYQTVTRNGLEAITNYVWVGDDPNPKAEGSEWTLNTSTGVITFATAPANGEPVYASFAYHVPCRFAESADNQLSGSIDQGGLVSFDRLEIEEIADTLEGSECWDPGGASIVAFSSNYSATAANGRFQILQPDGLGLSGILPDFNELRLGEEFWFWNDSAFDIQFQLHTNQNLFVLEAGDAITVAVLGNNGVAAGWFNVAS